MHTFLDWDFIHKDLLYYCLYELSISSWAADTLTRATAGCFRSLMLEG